jgi:hypothetical protein
LKPPSAAGSFSLANKKSPSAKCGLATGILVGLLQLLSLNHSIAMSADQWADDVRLSDIETRFVCRACGKRGADVRPHFQPARMGTSDMKPSCLVCEDEGWVCETHPDQPSAGPQDEPPRLPKGFEPDAD